MTTTEIKWTPYSACACVEGFDDEQHDEDEILSAWQYISDTKLWVGLQGWYGRSVNQLIQEGLINA